MVAAAPSRPEATPSLTPAASEVPVLAHRVRQWREQARLGGAASTLESTKWRCILVHAVRLNVNDATLPRALQAPKRRGALPA
jgi:hypothetical protein